MKTVLMRVAGVTAAGATAVWTPPAGFRFQLMGYTVFMESILTAAVSTWITLRDGAALIAVLGEIGATIPNAVAYTVNLPGDGYISTADAQSLNVNLSAALTAGTFWITAWGYQV